VNAHQQVHDPAEGFEMPAHVQRLFSPSNPWMRRGAAAAAVLALVAVGVAGGALAFLGLAALVGAVIVLAVRPAAATWIAIFVLYTNVLVVAAQRGTLPAGASAILPLLLAVAVVHHLVIRRERIVLDRTFVLMLLLLSVHLMGAFLAEGYDTALNRIGVFASEGLLIYFLVRNAVRTLPGLRNAMWAALAGACLLAALTTYQAVTGAYEQDFLGMAQRDFALADEPTVYGEEMTLEDRAGGPFNEPNRFAQVMLMTLPLALVFFMNARKRAVALTGAAMGLIVLGGIMLTYSRGAFVSMIGMAFLAMPFGLARPRRILPAVVVGALLAPIVVPGYADRIGSISDVMHLFGSTPETPDPVTRGRTTEMLAALAAYTDHPIIGVGPGQYLPYHSVHYQSLPEINLREIALPRRAHDLYLEVAAESGTLGLLVFMLIPLLLMRDLDRLRRDLAGRRPELSRMAAGFFLVLIAYLGTGIFLHLAFERYYWLMVALTASAVSVLQRASKDELKRIAPQREASAVTP
jgi:hypothetical protein